MWSNLIPLLQSEEGCPKGGVVGEKEGTPPPERKRMEIVLRTIYQTNRNNF